MEPEKDSNQINEEDQFQNQEGQEALKRVGSKKSITETNVGHYLPVSWEKYFDQMFYLQNGTSVFRSGNEGAIFLCIHGAARCALSFACLAKQVKRFGTLIAFDLKCHGHSKCNENPEDLSIQTLVSQSVCVFREIATRYPEQNIVLVGHQLGGSVAARVAHNLTNQQNQPRLAGIVILDAVEGLALEGLAQYNQRLSNRPKYFETIPEAIKWTQDTGALRRIESARVSIPSQLREIQYEGKPSYVWKVKLKRAVAGWKQWFTGLSKLFLSIKLPKILVSAEHQKLDQELTIAEMQGKFKHKIINGVGHQVHEDDWTGTARMLYFFINNFKIPMTVGESAEKQEKGIANFHPHLKPFDSKN